MASKSLSPTFPSSSGQPRTPALPARARRSLSILALGAAAALPLLPMPAQALDHPGIFINSAELKAVAAVRDREPWKSAYAKLLSHANTALSKGPWFQNERIINTEGNKQRLEAHTMGYNLIVLGLAWHFTREDKYLKRSEFLLERFCVNPATRMSPDAKKGLLGWNNSFMTVVYGTDLALPGLSPKVRDGVKSWFREFLASTLRHKEFGGVGGAHNRADWWVTMVMASSIVVDDPKGVSMGVEHWRKRSLSSNGSIRGIGGASGGDRAKEINYHYFALNALVAIVDMARHHGHALYDEEPVGGKSKFARMLDFYTGWAFANDKVNGANLGIYELAYAYRPEPKYLAIVNRLKRPLAFPGTEMEDVHCSFGLTTLTHARGAYAYDISGSQSGTTGLASAVPARRVTPWRLTDRGNGFGIPFGEAGAPLHGADGRWLGFRP